MGSTKEAADRHVQAFNDKDMDAILGNEQADIEWLAPGGITLRGQEQVREFIQIYWDAFPDLTVSATYQVVNGDTAVTESTYSGTHKGTLRTPQGDIPATGKRVQARQVTVQRVKDGLIASEHLYFDMLEFMTQLGLAPAHS